jgi:cyclic pyranopterin phosphate synthase
MSALAVHAEIESVTDRRGRPLRDLRISVTDRCNFRCPYCMPRSHYGPGHQFLNRREQLSVNEIARLAGVFVSLGVTKIRLTGGEPLLRAELADIVARLAALGVPDLALTTNGSLLRRWALRLRQAGLHRVTVSLDSLDPAVFAAMSDTQVDLAQVLDGIAAARQAGLDPIKLNCVVRRGVNDATLIALVEYARRERMILRFIEYMDVGTSNGWTIEDVVPGDEILERVSRTYALVEQTDEPPGVARVYRFADGGGELGLIASVSRPFCGDCTRARLGVDGRLYTCLFATAGLDLRGPLRDGADDQALGQLVLSRWQHRNDRYSEIRSSRTTSLRRIEMSYIGG